MAKLVLTRDTNRGVTTYFRPASEAGTLFHIETVQEISPLIEANKREANEWRPRRQRPNTQAHWQKIADIPEPLYWDLVKGNPLTGIPRLGEPKENPERWKRWLNDPDNRLFRTGGGNI